MPSDPARDMSKKSDPWRFIGIGLGFGLPGGFLLSGFPEVHVIHVLIISIGVVAAHPIEKMMEAQDA